jgi:hypothetical protein
VDPPVDHPADRAADRLVDRRADHPVDRVDDRPVDPVVVSQASEAGESLGAKEPEAAREDPMKHPGRIHLEWQDCRSPRV